MLRIERMATARIDVCRSGDARGTPPFGRIDREPLEALRTRVTILAVPFCGEGSPYPRGGNLVKARHCGGLMHPPTRMGRCFLLLLTVVAAALWFGVARARAADLLANGSFEQGDFTDWTATSPNDGCGIEPSFGDPWTVLASPASGWCYSGFDPEWPTSISSVDGSFFADVTWDGDGSADQELSQTV